MKKSLLIMLLFFFLFFVPLFFAAQDWLYATNVKVEMNVSSAFHITPLSDSYKLQSVDVNLSFVPKKTERQKLQSIITEPSAEISDDEIVYHFTPPFSKTNLFYSGVVSVQNTPVQVTKKVQFPYTSLPESVKAYLNATELIDADTTAVTALSSSLAEGADDAFVVVTRFAVWVQQNVVYNLSTLGEPATKKASWVVENKRGVCSELTTLFIALTRSVGIPARFASGIAYTDSELFQERWGGHAWAEVYFPEYGWVPFDPTYGQYGFVDSSHIVARYTHDAKDVTTNYKWIGKDVDVSLDKLKLKGAILSAKFESTQPISLSVSVLDERVQFGSYNVVQAAIKNKMPYYLSLPVSLVQVQDMLNVDAREKSITLLPEQEKTIFWIVQVRASLDDNFIYTLPIEVNTPYAAAKNEFVASKNEDAISFEKAKEFVSSAQEEIEKVYSKNVAVLCKPKQEYYYEYEVGVATCTMHNSGTVSLSDLRTCIQDDCQVYDLSVGKEKTFSLLFTPNSSESFISVTTENDIIKKTTLLNVTSYDVPFVSFADLSYPSAASYKDDVLITFLLQQKSKSIPYSGKVLLLLNGNEYILQKGDILGMKKINLSIAGKDLLPGKNQFTLYSIYEDKNKKQYESAQQFMVNLTEATFWQHIRAVIYRLFGVS